MRRTYKSPLHKALTQLTLREIDNAKKRLRHLNNTFWEIDYLDKFFSSLENMLSLEEKDRERKKKCLN